MRVNSTGRNPLFKWLAAIWLAFIIPFVVAAVSGGPSAPWGHATFHMGYIAATLLMVVLTWSLVRSTPNRVTRGLSIALICTLLVFLAGQVGELLVVASHHGPRAGEDALTDPMHDIPALALTAPGLLLSAGVLIALTVTAIVTSRRLRQRPSGQ
jgi:hypothetical protein